MSTDAIAEFISFMEANGVAPIEPIAQRLATGALIRFRCDGDSKGRQNGWAILYLDERPAGAFGNYRMNTGTLKWKSDATNVLSADERAALQREWAAMKVKRDEEKQRAEIEASKDAADLWQRAQPAAFDHPYLVAKRVDCTPLRQIGTRILVPMFDRNGALWNLQRIEGDGTKRFLRGGKVDDLFCLIGGFTRYGESAVIGEGYSTMSAVHDATGLPCIVSFTAANMIRVARIWNNARSDLHFTIFADDDAATALKPPFKNVGIEAATAAALEIGARIAKPMGKAA